MSTEAMTFDDVREALARRGMTGVDAETAFRAWTRNPQSADGCRVQAVLEAEGLIR